MGAVERPRARFAQRAALLHDIAKPDCFTVDERGRGHFYGHPEAGAKLAEKIMRRLSCSNDLIRDVSLLIHDHDRPLDPDRISLLRQMQRLARSGVDTARLMGELFDLKRADTLGKASGCFYYVEEIERMREMCRELLANREAYSIKTLDLAGSDLIACGMAPGPRIGRPSTARSRARSSGPLPMSARRSWRIWGFRVTCAFERDEYIDNVLLSPIILGKRRVGGAVD
ncbi:MAG: HD domain-containing protein [Collinsella sp.]